MKPDVVVVLTFRGRDDTIRCVSSLVDGNPEASVVVVDNGSGDDVLETVGGRWPQVATIQTGDNLGFAGGMNRGLDWALARDASTVTVLNNDTHVPPGAIRMLAERAQDGVAVSPEVRYASDGRVWFGGGVVDPETGLARHLTDAELARRFPGRMPRSVETLAGCCVTAPAAVWRRVGGFDERYFLIFEDADWSLRARRLGVDLLVDPSVHIDHAVSASFTGDRALLGLYYYARNGLLFGRRWRTATGTRDPRGAYRFLRRHALPEVTGAWRRGDRRAASHHQRVLGLAVAHHLSGRYGRAPAWLEERAAQWARASIQA
jgi:GT2 family glycosyltransferase